MSPQTEPENAFMRLEESILMLVIFDGESGRYSFHPAPKSKNGASCRISNPFFPRQIGTRNLRKRGLPNP
jgi:hypothetical protein